MELVDGPPAVATDLVPTVDQDVPLATYCDWRKEDTFIVRCAISNNVYPGPRFESRDDARIATERKHGRILEANYLPGQAFFRVMRPRPVS
jgi:hypothetical protein